MSAAMRRALQLLAILSPFLFGGYPTAAADICDPLDDEREVFTARDLCEVYEKSGTSTWGDLFARVRGRTEFRQSYALVIGVGDYDHWRNLEAPLGDAERVRDFLIKEAEFDLVVTLTNARATKQRIENLMEEFFPNRAGAHDRFLFYFSGHGTQRSLGGRKRGYLVLQPAREEGWAAMLGMNDVEDWADNLSAARQSLFVLDACFSGLAGTQPKGLLRDKTIERLTQYGHHLITAGTEEEQSIAVGGASLFTTAFIRAASGWGDFNALDQPADGVVSLKELTEYISRYLDAELARLRGHYRMTPQITKLQYDSAGEFFFLAESPGGEPPPSERATADAAPDAKGETSTMARLEPTPEPSAGPPVVNPAVTEAVMVLTRAEWREVQRGLAELGYSPGPADGVPGPQTRSALRAWQRAQGEEATGYLMPDQHEALVAAASEVDVAVGVYPGGDVITPGSQYLEPLSVFRDCAECPEMVVVPAGSFLMGSPPGEKECDVDEGPQHEVQIAYRFAAGRYPVTFEEYDRFAAAVGREPPTDQRWDRGRRPVINVSWNDAQAYVGWLSKETGKPYRLLSEAEWEYAARAGTTTRYPWGDEITPKNANYGRNVGKTTEVGSYPPNPWGLHDMHGNVWEWVEDCWNESYQGAPSDGSAWTSGDCDLRVLRGGSWAEDPGGLRSANRSRGSSGLGGSVFGFRVARTLSRSES